MPRKKSSDKAITMASVRDIMHSNHFEPLGNLIKLAQFYTEYRDGDEKLLNMEDYEVVRDTLDGKRYLRPRIKHLIAINSELAQYQYPKLRATETKGQMDYNFNITIKKFEDAPIPARVTDVEVKQLDE